MRKVQLIESVDNALQLLLLLSGADSVRVSDVASRLEVAPATAHRLLGTLKYRGFVEQKGDRSYVRGPALQQLGTVSLPLRPLDEIAREQLTWLRDQTGETTHLSVLDGARTRFVLSVESNQALRVTSRSGTELPAHLTSGGKCLLAALPPEQLDLRYPRGGAPDLGLDADEVAALRRGLDAVRRRGYGVNRGEGERGISAVGMSIRDAAGGPRGALSISLPSVRFSASRLRTMVALLGQARSSVEDELAR